MWASRSHNVKARGTVDKGGVILVTAVRVIQY